MGAVMGLPPKSKEEDTSAGYLQQKQLGSFEAHEAHHYIICK